MSRGFKAFPSGDLRECKDVVLYPDARLTYWQLCGLVKRLSETGSVIGHIGTVGAAPLRATGRHSGSCDMRWTVSAVWD